MISIDFSPSTISIKNKNGQSHIFDVIRKKWLILTDEEWVRQNLIHYLIHQLHYPASLIAVEKEFKIGTVRKRFDILVYNQQHQPWMLIECKAADIALSEMVLQQVIEYGSTIHAPYIIISNGNFTYGWKRNQVKLDAIELFPEFITHH
ncbi:MAG: type I restriction enzyme HsdR N-terminal domain-containing protein [Bacteroidia bacterium]|nr:MAG: type I restriction enzyme HsdR N-terminal domain-containing protein [Bacteroidia bacterium]